MLHAGRFLVDFSLSRKQSTGVSVQDCSHLFVKTEEKSTQQFKVKCTLTWSRSVREPDASCSEGRFELKKQKRHRRNPSAA